MLTLKQPTVCEAVPDMEDLHNLRSQPRNHRKKPNYVTEEETRYLEPLIEKHGTDYTVHNAIHYRHIRKPHH